MTNRNPCVVPGYENRQLAAYVPLPKSQKRIRQVPEVEGCCKQPQLDGLLILPSFTDHESDEPQPGPTGMSRHAKHFDPVVEAGPSHLLTHDIENTESVKARPIKTQKEFFLPRKRKHKRKSLLIIVSQDVFLQQSYPNWELRKKKSGF
nr:PREDICTED: uncharacterized protein LOC107398594 [Tribolium castaneum]|eukprot:XP_015838615.1 PREDICTED: uncharacterized protein LOC107398594 [Tribolium castaneum]